MLLCGWFNKGNCEIASSLRSKFIYSSNLQFKVRLPRAQTTWSDDLFVALANQSLNVHVTSFTCHKNRWCHPQLCLRLDWKLNIIYVWARLQNGVWKKKSFIYMFLTDIVMVYEINWKKCIYHKLAIPRWDHQRSAFAWPIFHSLSTFSWI